MIFGSENSILTAWNGETQNLVEGQVAFDVVAGGVVTAWITVQSQTPIQLPFSSSSDKPIVITEEVFVVGEEKLFTKTFKVLNVKGEGFMKVHGEEEDCSISWNDLILTDNLGRKFDLVKNSDLISPQERMEIVNKKIDATHFVMKMMEGYEEKEN